MKNVLAALFAAVLVCSTASAQNVPPLVLTHQGFLLDDHDQPVSGERKIKISVYGNSAPQQNEEPLWSDTYTVTVAQGRYRVLIGSKLEGGTQLLTASTFPGDAPRWMAIAVDDGTDLLPRQRIGVVPVALSASTFGGHTPDKYLLKADADALYVKNQGTSGVSLPSLTLTATSGAPLTVTSQELVANLNANLLEGKRAADFAPATGSTAYAPATGSTAYAPATGSTAYAPATGSTAYAPAEGSPNYAPATGSPNYAPATGSPNYAPATGSPSYVAKASNGDVEIAGKLTFGGNAPVVARGQFGDPNVTGGTTTPYMLAGAAGAYTGGYMRGSYGGAFAAKPVLVITPWEPDGSGHTACRIQSATLTEFMFYCWSYTNGNTGQWGFGGVTWAALPAGTYTAGDGAKMVAGMVNQKGNECQSNCQVNFPAGTFQNPPVVVAAIDESYNDGGATEVVIENTTSSGFTFTTSHNYNNAYKSEYIHWIAIDPGTHDFGPHLRVGAGSQATTSSSGTLNIGANADAYVNPPVVLSNPFRGGGASNASAVRLTTSMHSKTAVTWEAYTANAGGTPFKLNWIAVDTH